ncbi:MAG: FecR family protein, partial [Candidatus Cryptobacteroides sp.]
MERELLVRFLLCETTEQEEQKVLDWLDASPENVRMLESLDSSFSASVLNAPRYARIKKARRTGNALKYLGYAASLLAVCLGLGASFWLGSQSVEQPQAQMVTVSTPKGQRTHLTLQDGTRVCLNGGSTIIYPTIFDEHARRVKLTGEAMFDVTSDQEHPFYVDTYAATVKVTGTNFDVIADSGRGVFSTTLFRGSVSL